jgi:ketol-acid reductoisomerase
MAATIFYEKDADPTRLAGKRIAILGYGSQGHAHALNLKDSGHDVVIGLPETSQSIARAKEAGLSVQSVGEAVAASDIIMTLVPDPIHAELFRSEVLPALGRNQRAGSKTLMFAHGFSVHFKTVELPANVDVSMIAPKAPGHVMRDLFTQGVGVPALLAVAQDVSGNAKATALAYGHGVGCAKAGVLETTFREETETDLFGEQVCICGGVSALIKQAFETLTEAGYQPEVAYFECLHEMKLIVDLMYQGGLRYMHHSISDTAEYGDYTRGPRIIDERTRGEMKKILGEIQSGAFAKEWGAEHASGRAAFLAHRQRDGEHPIEQVGGDLRKMMSWIKPPRR